MVWQQDWEIPDDARPRVEDVPFDLDRMLSSVVNVRAIVPDDAFTAPILGTDRFGNGLSIRDGVILTIGYLVTEAEQLWMTTSDGRVMQGSVMAYDHETGFGLIRSHGDFKIPTIPLGSAHDARINDPVIIAAGGGRRHALNARIVSKREFAGSWEYVLDQALFTAPAHPSWGGTGLIDRQGRLVGVGSLYVQRAREHVDLAGNMFVPVEYLKSILDDLIHLGRPAGQAPRPWLGLYLAQSERSIVVVGIASGGPAQQADVRPGDQVIEVAGHPVDDLATTFRRIWAMGDAGAEIPLTLRRNGRTLQLVVRSTDRTRILKSPQRH
ncbi:MAG: serine protease [Alphaproteobacteria bacterium]|nr:serine protease [Alphaproteobacteria bacterium]